MQRFALSAICFLLVLLPVGVVSAQETALIRLENNLDSVKQVRFYFLNRTEDYNYSNKQLIEASAIQVRRNCGKNCAEFMRDVLSHFRQAKPVKCEKGQQNVLVGIGSKDLILYSYSGRQITYAGKCYYNSDSVNGIIQKSDFIF